MSTRSFSAFQPVIPKPVLVHGVIAPQVWNCHFSFTELMSVCFSNLSRSLWITAQLWGVSATPPSSVSSAYLLCVHSVPASRMPVKGLKECGHLFWSLEHNSVFLLNFFSQQESQNMKNINVNHIWGTTKVQQTCFGNFKLSDAKFSEAKCCVSFCSYVRDCIPFHNSQFPCRKTNINN